MVIDCYTAEAAVTMVGGLIDAGYEEYQVEAAISKVYATECLWRTADEALQIAGGNGYMREYPYERIVRDSRINRIFEGTNEILRLLIALTAMNDVASQLQGCFASTMKGHLQSSRSRDLGCSQITPAKHASASDRYRRGMRSSRGWTRRSRSKGEIFEEETRYLAQAADQDSAQARQGHHRASSTTAIALPKS